MYVITEINYSCYYMHGFFKHKYNVKNMYVNNKCIVSMINLNVST